MGPACKAYSNTILSELTAARFSWRYYTNALDDLWSGPTADAACWAARDSCWSNIIAPSETVLADIASHRLANIAFVNPEHATSDHPGFMSNAQSGQNWVASIVNAIGNDPYYWSNTTILLTWDDWGGWYDHVPPPRPPFNGDPYEYGFRVPLVVVSPYVTPGQVDHTTRNSYGSILRYIETTFRLQSLGQVDAPSLTDDLTSLFNYRAKPRSFQPM
jgi:phospholipase C